MAAIKILKTSRSNVLINYRTPPGPGPAAGFIFSSDEKTNQKNLLRSNTLTRIDSVNVSSLLPVVNRPPNDAVASMGRTELEWIYQNANGIFAVLAIRRVLRRRPAGQMLDVPLERRSPPRTDLLKRAFCAYYLSPAWDK